TLHLGLGIEVVEHHLAHFTPTQLDDHTHAVLIGLVTQLADAFELLFLDQLGDLLDQPRLVQLIRQLGDDDLLTTTHLVHVFDFSTGAHIDAPATGAVSLDDAGPAIDDACRGEIRARDVLHQLIDRQLGAVHQRQTAIHDLTEVVRRNVGGHPHGDAAGAVDSHRRPLGGQHGGILFDAVVVVYPLAVFRVQVGQHRVGQLGHAHFGVSHGRGAVAIHPTEVALNVYQQVAQRERLGHSYDGVVHSAV